MTQSPKIQKPKRKEKLSDKEQSERFKEAAHLLDSENGGEFFLAAVERIVLPNKN